uniref:Uncoupling protein 1 n=1 Tax=Oncorhynchus tshawytscha TaxID=74940 RepID=A0AAZ3SPC6_ONCTS
MVGMNAGSAACIADLVTFPWIQPKFRREGGVGSYQGHPLQGVFGTISTMIRTEGPRSLYNGLVAGLQRQMCFASIRIGFYDNVKNFYSGGTDTANIGIRILAGCTTGAMAVSFAQPTDVVKVRFQAQVNLTGVARRYTGTMQAYKHIFNHEGIRGLWKGCLPNITRNALVNCTELVTYDLIKRGGHSYNLLSDNLPCHFASAFGTRYMNSPPGQYKSAINCAWTMATKEGPTAFYKGLGSWNVVMFVSFEQLKRVMMVGKQKMEDKS